MVSWFTSLAIALLTGLVALLAGGVVADLCVGWYRISSFEGASGYFVILVALLSGGAGAVVGLLIARAVAAVPAMNALKTAGLAVVAVLLVAGGVAGAARLLADVPPELDGERLFLLVELRWPGSARPPGLDQGPGIVRLGTLSGSTMRREEAGPLFLEDARQEQGHWTVPGVVEIFTTRGTPVLNVFVGDTRVASLRPPLRRYPQREDLAWSEWQQALPLGQGPGVAPVSYRFRVSRRTAPARTQQVGPFTVHTIVRDFARFGDIEAIGAVSTFHLQDAGRDLLADRRIEDVAIVSTKPWALLVRDGEGCRLVKQGEAAASPSPSQPCEVEPPPPSLLTLTATVGSVTPTPTSPRIHGWLDTVTFRAPGLYIAGAALLDTRTLVLTPHGWPTEPGRQQDVPPLALSPDERTVVWFSPGNGYDTAPVIAARRLDTGGTATFPLDRARMRYRTAQLDMTPEWFAHHFEWSRDADGIDVLHARPDAVPLPYRGALSEGGPGAYQTYQLSPGGRPLRDAVYDILVKELHGTPREEEPATVDTPRVEIDGVIYSVTFSRGGDTVTVTTYKTRPEAMARMADRLDAIVVSGRLDGLFTPDPPAP
ncbi:hypothetical protein LuPra_04128 [Luteitalea pratensis]|uniref:Uncharacterized protein n=1 Tax=Luteitalea pratensis TaxID=1855912 RepID=A0A143PQL1_LUTPR|nr:hypothetical protein [Luteitalea pratensis]AMY10885.1 hypothetical protein LuPra_04128 [Luteitalea pratensis]